MTSLLSSLWSCKLLYMVFCIYNTTAAKSDCGSSSSSSSFLWRYRKNSCCVLRQSFILRDYTVRLSGTWQGFVVSHTFLDNMADLLIWHGVHPCHLITGRILILKRQHVSETDGERETQCIWGGKKKNGMNSQTDGACMIDEQYKAIHFTLGAGLNRLKSAHCNELITWVTSSYKLHIQ